MNLDIDQEAMRRASCWAILLSLAIMAPAVVADGDEDLDPIMVGSDTFYVDLDTPGIFQESNGCEFLQTEADAARTDCPPADDQVL